MPLPLITTTITVVQGAQITRTLQGVDLDGSIPTQFLSTDTLSGTVWIAQNEPATINFTPTWVNAPSCQVSVALTGAQTASLSIDTTYNLQVFATRSGVTYCIGWVYLVVLPAAGTQAVAAPPDLITAAYAAQMLNQTTLTPSQLEQIPNLITAASDALRSWCNNYFSQNTWTKEFTPALNGQVRLDYVPVNQVLKVKSSPQVALTITNTTAQEAYVGFTLTGDVVGGQTITGLTLTTSVNGTTSSTPVAYTTNMTITGLANAVNLIGGGWLATVSGNYGAWPALELFGGQTAQGAATTDEGASFWIYSTTLTNAQLDPDNGQWTGMLRVGTQYGGLGPQWGPDWLQWDDPGMTFQGGGRVYVSYNSGYATIPRDVQKACVDLVKYYLSLLLTDGTIKSETIGKFKYEMHEDLEAMPRYIREVVARYRIHST